MGRITVIIAAGGVGSRAGIDVPKQFYEIKGKPIIAYTLDVFEQITEIDEIIISANASFIEKTKDIVRKFGFSKVSCVLEGGDTRQQSVYKALGMVGDDTDYILIHDAARPFINRDSVLRCISDVKETGCAAVGKRAVDTMKRTDDRQCISETVDRTNLWHIQTPQAFERRIITECHEKCVADGAQYTDDCMICEKYGYKIRITEASSINMKITQYEDILLAEAILGV